MKLGWSLLGEKCLRWTVWVGCGMWTVECLKWWAPVVDTWVLGGQWTTVGKRGGRQLAGQSAALGLPSDVGRLGASKAARCSSLRRLQPLLLPPLPLSLPPFPSSRHQLLRTPAGPSPNHAVLGRLSPQVRRDRVPRSADGESNPAAIDAPS